MTTYYDILGIEENATEREIKSAYRTLAKMYHPDVNNDPGAHQRFIAVDKAYTILGDSTKRANYDRGLEYLRSRNKVRRESDQKIKHQSSRDREAYVHSERYKFNRARVLRKRKREKEENQRFLRRFNKYGYIVSILSLVFALSFFTDYYSTQLGAKEQVMSKDFLYSLTMNADDLEYYRIRTNKGVYRLHETLAREIKTGNEVQMSFSPFYGINVGILIHPGEQTDPKYIESPFVSASFRFFALLIIAALLTVTSKPRSERLVNLTFISGILLMINLLFLFLELIG